MVAILIFLSNASANPDIQFPVNSQVPPVALTSQPYTFTFAESTFTSATSPVTYALSDGPVWLQLDSETRTFSGRPRSDDIGSVTFQLIATDTQGPTPMNVTLIVARDGGLQVGQSILSQLAGFGMPSSSSSLLFYPLQSFVFSFLPDTFLQTSSNTTYYAISADNSPLPSWLEFDASNLGFSGTTPPLVSPTATPQTYGVKLAASNVPGFLEASAVFQIIVGYHVLSFSAANEDVNATSGQKVVTPPLLYTLILDGKGVQDSDLASVTADAPSWLVLDYENISLSGIPPANADNFSVIVSAMDVHGDIANASVNFFMSSLSRLFLDDEPLANATIGHDFNYSISRSSLASGNVTVMADLGSASAWLTFHPSDLSFDGKVPQDLAPAQINITLYATLGNDTDMEILRIDVIRGSATTSVSHNVTSSASAKSTSSSTPGSLDSSDAAGHSPLSRSTRLTIVLAVILPALVVILLMILLISCLQRKQKLPAKSSTVPGPVPAPPVGEHVETELRYARPGESIHDKEMQRQAAPNEPPRVELSWAPDSLRKANARVSKHICISDDSVPSPRFSGSISQDLGTPLDQPMTENDATNQITTRSGDLTPFVSPRRSNYSQNRAPLRPIQSKTEEGTAPKRASRALSAISMAAFGLPSRLSGAGHGAGGAGSPGFKDIRSSWQDNESSLPSIDGRATTLNIVEAFPQPPIKTVGRRSIMYPQRGGKASLRMVATSSSQTRTSTEERQRWFTERARDPHERGARFSHSWSSRRHSVRRPLETEKSTLGHDDQLNSLNSAYAPRSENAAAGVLVQPHITTLGRSPARPPARPPSKFTQDRSTASSGQFDSALSTSSSQWEDDILAMEVDFHRDTQYHPTESTRRNSHGIPLRNVQSSRSGMTATRLSEVSSAEDLNTSPASRKLRLGDVPGQRPVSGGERSLQKSQRSHQGSLAFV